MKFRPGTVAVTQARTASLLNAALPSLTSFTRIRGLQLLITTVDNIESNDDMNGRRLQRTC